MTPVPRATFLGLLELLEHRLKAEAIGGVRVVTAERTSGALHVWILRTRRRGDFSVTLRRLIERYGAELLAHSQITAEAYDLEGDCENGKLELETPSN